eukprot:Rmarinus@m.8037
MNSQTRNWKKKIQILEKEHERFSKKLMQLKDGGTEPISEDEKRKIEKAYDVAKNHWKQRRRWFYDALDTACGDAEKPSKLLKDMECVETDEDAGVSLKNLPEVSIRAPPRKIMRVK